MDAPATCSCGQVAERLFTPTQNVHIPTHFKAVRANGAEGGYSWSDFHARSERELAHVKELNGRPVEIVPAREAASRSSYMSPEKAREKEISDSVDRAYKRAFDDATAITTRS